MEDEYRINRIVTNVQQQSLRLNLARPVSNSSNITASAVRIHS